MTETRTILAELVRALAVLALVLLALSPTAATAVPGYHGDAAQHDFCGSAPDALAHAPCHACRADPASLPPAPTDCARAFVALLAAPFDAAVPLSLAAPHRGQGNPRAPPETA